jgi:cystathionine gamma-lyase
MEAHGTNALLVARALENSPHVKEVIYPGLATHPRHALAYKSLSLHAKKWVDSIPRGAADSDGAREGDGIPFGGMISFRIRGSAHMFLTATRLFTLAELLGGVKSLAELPSEMTHGSVPAEERALLGIGDDLIRLSVGVKEGEDLAKDI